MKLFTKQLAQKKGFSLIEIMVAIAIIGVLSTISYTSFQQAQMRARDQTRKKDLRSMAVSLELYFTKNSRFPCAGWRNSNTNKTDWVADTVVSGITGCTGTGTVSLAPEFINTLPVDPLNSGTNPTADGNYVYGYRGWECAPQTYILIAELENKNDPERVELNNKTLCGIPYYATSGSQITTSKYKFIITAN